MSATARTEVLAFAVQFPTPNVLRAVAYAEAGTLTWEQVRTLAAGALTKALAAAAT